MNKEIHAYYSSGLRKYQTEPRFQYDNGQLLLVHNLPEEAQMIEAQFTNAKLNTTLNVSGEKKNKHVEFKIPPSIMMFPRDVIAYVSFVDEESGYTVLEIVIPMISRARPADYIYTPEQIQGYTQLMSQLNEAILDAEELEVRVNEAVKRAEEAAQRAEAGGGSGGNTGGGSSLPAGGTEGQVLVKTKNDAEWQTLTPEKINALPSSYTPPDQTAEQVGADPVGTASSLLSSHNTNNEAHSDLRLALKELAERLDAFFDADDKTLDELSELIEYIKNNKTLIDGITTSKINVSDIVDNLTTNLANRPLSAAQGVALKALIDAIKMPTALSELSADASHRLVTDAEKTAWNAKSNFSGAYNDLTGKPTIPTVPTNISAFQNDAGYLTKHQDISGKLDANKLPEAIEDALEQAKASGEFDGKNGEPGTSPTVATSKSGKVTTVTFTDKNGIKTATINDGADGQPGKSGVHIGAEEPTDPDINVWIDEDEEEDADILAILEGLTDEIENKQPIGRYVKTVNGAAPDANGNVDVSTGNGVSLTDTQRTKCQEFAALFKDTTGCVESFVFFTDPHFGGSTEMSTSTKNHLCQIAEVYNNTPTSMCVCGGDWLNDSNAKENACWQLGVFDGQMKALFDRYVMIVGNHDTNYQGKEYIDSGADGTYDRETHEQCILSTEALRNLWHRKQRASYFIVDGDSTKFYIFDTGLDWYPDMDDYKWRQVDWFAKDLLSSKPERCVALLHIAGYASSNPTLFIANITQIAKAYNDRSSVTVNGITYDYSAVTGKFYFILGGHTHEDLVYMLNDVVVITSTNLHAAVSKVTFDLVLVDYDAEKIHMVRVGSGNSRAISLVDGSVIESENNGETGDDVVTANLFDIGRTASDYVQHNGNAVSGSELTVDAISGSLISSSLQYGERFLFRVKEIENDGARFRLRFTVSNEVDKAAMWGIALRLYDADGERVSNADISVISKPEVATDFAYVEYWGAYHSSSESATMGSTTDNDIIFTIPDNVKAFQIGFQFATPYQGEAGTLVTFKNIYLTKE